MTINQEMEQILFQLILHAGSARSFAKEAGQFAEEGDWEAAEKALADANEEQNQAHKINTTIITKAARGAGITPAQITEITEVPGYGSKAIWQGKEARLGRAGWVGAEALAQTATFLKIGDQPALAFIFTDRLREGAAEAVQALTDSGKAVYLMSGDTTPAVAALAQRLNISNWLAEALPADKSARIQDMTAKGAHVLMVGDGLNDTAALAAADVSISPASALDAARVASDIVLLGHDLSPISAACTTARAARRRITENFTIATVYNVVAVPLAMAGFATPLIAALAMSASSITVSLNALRLR